MGIIARQASSNAVYTLTGVIFGAMNTIVVLPLAFAEFKSGWGVLSFILSWAVIFAQFFSVGSSGVLVNFLPKAKSDEERQSVIDLMAIVTLIGAAALGVGLYFGREAFLSLVDDGDIDLLRHYLPHLFVLSAAMILTQFLMGYALAGLRSTLITLLNDPFLKISYLAIAVAYLFDIIDFDIMVWLFVGSYISVLLILLVNGLRHGLKFGGRLSAERSKSALDFGLFAILDRGAQTISQRLDIIMIGALLDLENVAEYVIAFFIGSVVMIPYRSITAVAFPVVSGMMRNKDSGEVTFIHKRTMLFGLLLGGLIFSGVWVSISEVFSLLPEKFDGGEYVVLFIGLSRLFHALSGVSAAAIVYSERYRSNLVFNIGFVLLTIATNYLLIPHFGITGAAMATAISTLAFSLAKLAFIKSIFGVDSLSTKLLSVGAAITAICVMLPLLPSAGSALLDIALKSVICIVLFAGLTLGLGVHKDLPAFFSKNRRG